MTDAANPPALAPELLQLGPLPPGLTERLQRDYRLFPLWQQADPAALLASAGGRFAGAVMMSRHACREAELRALAGRVVACFGVGYDNIDLAAARTHGVAVSVTPDVLTDCVADTAWTLLLGSARKVVQADRFVRQGEWLKGGFSLGPRVSGKRLGVLGLGRIGSAIAQRAGGFGMPVRYFGRRARPDSPWTFEANLVDLAGWADFLVVACQGGAATRHLVDAEVLKALGPGGFVVNIARGSVIDEAALVTALEQGVIAGAGLDVFEHEPNVPQALIDSERVVLLPHIAALTRETRAAMEALVHDNLRAFFATGRVLTPPG